MVARIRGRSVPIVAADTDTNILVTPVAKEFRCTRYLVSNNGGAPTRVRVFDTFTDSDGNVHTTAALTVVHIDRILAAGETAEVLADILSGIFTGMGTLIAQATVAGAFPADITAGCWGYFE